MENKDFKKLIETARQVISTDESLTEEKLLLEHRKEWLHNLLTKEEWDIHRKKEHPDWVEDENGDWGPPSGDAEQQQSADRIAMAQKAIANFVQLQPQPRPPQQQQTESFKESLNEGPHYPSMDPYYDPYDMLPDGMTPQDFWDYLVELMYQIQQWYNANCTGGATHPMCADAQEALEHLADVIAAMIAMYKDRIKIKPGDLQPSKPRPVTPVTPDPSKDYNPGSMPGQSKPGGPYAMG